MFIFMHIYLHYSLSSCYLSTIYVPNSPCIYVLWWTLLLIFCWEWNIGVVFLDNRLDAYLTLVDTAKWFWKCLYHLKFPSIMYQFTTDSFSHYLVLPILFTLVILWIYHSIVAFVFFSLFSNDVEYALIYLFIWYFCLWSAC